MKPLEQLDQILTVDGRKLTLYRRGGFYYIKIGNLDLMTNENHGSEEALAELAFAALDRRVKKPRVLVGGLGMGFTLRAALDLLPRSGGQVVVAELFSEVKRWNEEHLGHLADHPLRDSRASVALGDIHQQLEPGAWDLLTGQRKMAADQESDDPHAVDQPWRISTTATHLGFSSF